MEGRRGSEARTLVRELTQGMELTKRLRLHSNSPTSSAATREFLAQRILSTFDKALSTLKQSVPAAAAAQLQLEPPVSFNASAQNKDRKDVCKKRKMLPKWTDHVRVSSGNGIESSMDDGYSWRKYGQKDILGTKYPRSYYRCIYRNMQDCWATKLVQRSDEDPSIFEVTYKGTHTCGQSVHPILAPASSEKQEHKQDREKQQQQPSLLVDDTEDLQNKDMLFLPFSFPPESFASEENESQFCTLPMMGFSDFTGSYSPAFIYPWTSESDYLAASPAKIFSANTSTTNSPILDQDFSTDPASFDSFTFSW